MPGRSSAGKHQHGRRSSAATFPGGSIASVDGIAIVVRMLLRKRRCQPSYHAHPLILRSARPALTPSRAVSAQPWNVKRYVVEGRPTRTYPRRRRVPLLADGARFALRSTACARPPTLRHPISAVYNPAKRHGPAQGRSETVSGNGTHRHLPIHYRRAVDRQPVFRAPVFRSRKPDSETQRIAHDLRENGFACFDFPDTEHRSALPRGAHAGTRLQKKSSKRGAPADRLAQSRRLAHRSECQADRHQFARARILEKAYGRPAFRVPDVELRRRLAQPRTATAFTSARAPTASCAAYGSRWRTSTPTTAR